MILALFHAIWLFPMPGKPICCSEDFSLYHLTIVVRASLTDQLCAGKRSCCELAGNLEAANMFHQDRMHITQSKASQAPL